jgi:hypothetical protein
MDVGKVAAGLYHYVAVDDCTRYRVLGLFPRRSAMHTIAFLERVVEEMPFPIQRVQPTAAVLGAECPAMIETRRD